MFAKYGNNAFLGLEIGDRLLAVRENNQRIFTPGSITDDSNDFISCY
ncbi:MAG: hypothetical protein PUP92_30105 [Rhizonema sp. PD38]|nr:hypothetical protein [Rhizonema sp. PD38]